GVVSTDGVVPACESYDCITIFASTLNLADRAMAVLAAGAPSRPWPADVRLAAPPEPVVAIPDELPELDRRWRAAFDAAAEMLAARGCRVVTVEIAPFLAAAKLLYDGALISERYAAVGEFIDANPDATLDPTVSSIVAAARDVPAHRLVHDRLEV
ncbi:allophanate hydrolase, partial [Mycobacterium sp. ITM-2017-0098]